ncbi:MAG: CvpA family protein [Acutalibacteraceae bacterium]
MNWILDGIIVIILAVAVSLGAKKGFAHTVTELVCYLLAIIISVTASARLSVWIYDRFARESIVAAVTDNLNLSGYDAITAQAQNTEELVSAVQKAVDENSFLKISAKAFGLTDEKISDALKNIDVASAEELANKLSDDLLEPIFTKLLEFVLFFVMIILLFLLIKPVAKLINKLFSFSFIGGINKLLGGVAGIFTGAVIAMVFVIFVNYAVTLSSNEILGINSQTIQNTYIFKYLINLI